MSRPPWVVLHVPHDSTTVPAAVRPQFLLDDAELERELARMTDHRTLALFADPSSDTAIVRSPVSRLVVDVERFPNDSDEPMAARGMGAVYTVTSQLMPLRRRLRDGEREALTDAYYRPHHQRLEEAVSAALDRHGRCLLIDCHGFPSVALPYELAAPEKVRPDICIGTDDFHTSRELADAFVSAFQSERWTVGVDDPFPGALVPGSRYRKDKRVEAVMVEVNRRWRFGERAQATIVSDVGWLRGFEGFQVPGWTGRPAQVLPRAPTGRKPSFFCPPLNEGNQSAAAADEVHVRCTARIRA